jgi:hypothetical protein
MRKVVATMWDGPRAVVMKLPDDVAALSDEEVNGWLRALELVPPADTTMAVRRARLASFPTQADLDQIATTMTAWNDGIRPVVRVIEKAINWTNGVA